METQLLQLADQFYRLELNQAVLALHPLMEEVVFQVTDLYTRGKITSEQVHDMNQHLHLLMECLENHDYILVADLLRFEITVNLNGLTQQGHQG